jgi:hypothetical protein
MSPEWKAVFRQAAERADELGLELAIASSPGWSESGGPWVTPQDAMKKLVWSEVTIVGGKRYHGLLPHPPTATGPYQTLPIPKTGGITEKAPTGVEFYHNAAVVAYREGRETLLPKPESVTANGQPVDADALLGDALNGVIPVPGRSGNDPGAIEVRYAEPQTVGSAVVFVSDLSPYSMTGALQGRLEVADEHHAWRSIAEIPLTAVPTTVSFAPVKAATFRVAFTHAKPSFNMLNFAIAPGADMAALAAMGDPTHAPVPKVAQLKLLAQPRVNAFEQKAGFAIAESYYEGLDAAVGSDASGVAPESVIDITDRMAADGTLDWKPPAGRWRILRIGYSLTGKTNHPATDEATGLEVDKYDRAAVGRYLNTYLSMYRDATADRLGSRGVRALVTDSTEVGPSNWTADMIADFERLRGYDPRPWLPALTGTIVGSRDQSDRFLYDFRRTLGDLMATEHYGEIASVAHQNGLTLYGESLEGARVTLGDDIEMRRFTDIPMAALWTYKTGPDPKYLADMRGASSTAHVYGRTFVAAESLTSILAPWAFAPADLQPMIDVEFAQGINRPVIHTSVHQPLDDKVPGLSLMIFGQYFNRHETWAEMAKPWVDYMARNSFLLQQGRNVADVAYFYGEDTPLGPQASRHYFSDVPLHYAYDFISPDGILNELHVDGDALVTRGGARYRAIYLGGQSQRLTLPVLRRLAELVEGGATLIGQAPEASLGLQDNGQKFSELVARLWKGGPGNEVGKGHVFAGTNNIESALAARGITPDFHCGGSDCDGSLWFVHRHIDDGDIYFVDNRLDQARNVDAHFRVHGKRPQIWHADSGEVTPVSFRAEDAGTVIPLSFAAHESYFVVFRTDTSQRSAEIAPPSFSPLAPLDGPWEVSFQPGRGAPSSAHLDALTSLADNADPGIRYFSGVATYTKHFQVPKGLKPRTPLLIDLGKVGDVAEVRVNGQFAGTAWKAPYRVNIGPFIRNGDNLLEVRVADLWVNRLIGDAQPNAVKITFTALPTYTAKAPLRASGLIGPVALISESAGSAP